MSALRVTGLGLMVVMGLALAGAPAFANTHAATPKSHIVKTADTGAIKKTPQRRVIRQAVPTVHKAVRSVSSSRFIRVPVNANDYIKVINRPAKTKTPNLYK